MMTTLHARVPAAELPLRGASSAARPARARVLNQEHAEHVRGAVSAAHVRQLVDAGAYREPATPAVLGYRMRAGAHQQTGIVVEVSISEFREGRIRGHEATQPERERQLDVSTEAAGFEQLPVTLTHRSTPALRALLDDVATGQPDLHVTTTAQHDHTVWIRTDADLLRAAQDSLEQIDTLYIADGHHRMAAAERYASRRSNAAAPFTLAAIFPMEEMRVLGYHRCLTRPHSLSTAEVLEGIARVPGTGRIAPRAAESPTSSRGTVAVFLDGRWYELRLAPSGTGPRDSVDAVLLQEQVLTPLAEAAGLDPAADITPLPGTVTGAEAARHCAESTQIGFLLEPPAVQQILAVADAGQVLPAKSTWFAPKVQPGLFVRDLAP